MSDIDTVAEAIGAADTGPMDGLYRRMAQAAIDALELTQEWGATCPEWKGGRMVRETRADAEDDVVLEAARKRNWSEPPAYPLHLECRLVSPWVEDQS